MIRVMVYLVKKQENCFCDAPDGFPAIATQASIFPGH